MKDSDYIGSLAKLGGLHLGQGAEVGPTVGNMEQ